ncbi:hypothetical protein RHMOL_Rhmol02G0076500 [Rhododendron molle]|uniref:Uncharacterized protein n=1 Tax=Rhododendron molle TaxID=49168 RepID=A0ACC0PP18_RHOML|nr:hypothetical protein RHMOL_Rhmol02G0076500 [Rhododendron molle]
MSSLSSSSLDSSPPSSYGIPLQDVLDKRLLLPRNQEEEAVVLAVKIALACLRPNPLCRPTMQQVSVALSKHKSHLQNPFFMITLGQLLDVNFPNAILVIPLLFGFLVLHFFTYCAFLSGIGLMVACVLLFDKQ